MTQSRLSDVSSGGYGRIRAPNSPKRRPLDFIIAKKTFKSLAHFVYMLREHNRLKTSRNQH